MMMSCDDASTSDGRATRIEVFTGTKLRRPWSDEDKARIVAESTPLLCAEVRPQMRGLVGWGAFHPLIVAADTIDPLQP